MKSKRKARSLLSTLVFELILFLIVCAIITFGASIFLLIKVFIEPSDYLDTPFEDNQELFMNAEYNKINIEKQLGEGSYFLVYDENGVLLYQSVAHPLQLSKKQIDDIPDVENSEISKDVLSNNETRYTFKNIDSEVTDTIITDGENILYSSFEFDHNNLDILLGIYQDYKIRKKEVTVNNTKKAIIFFTANYHDTLNVETFFLSILYVFFAVIGILVVTLYVYLIRVNSRISKPLKTLQEKVANFKIGEKVKVKYKGPKEFEELFAKFEEMADSLATLEQEKQNSINEKRKILSDISHDLKTPISIVKSYSDAIKSDLLSADEKSEYLGIITKNIDYLTVQINEFSDYNMMESPEFNLKLKPTNLFELTRDYIISRYDELDYLNHQLDVEIIESTSKVMIDEFQIKKVFNNIISNAIKYSQNSTIYISAFEDEQFVYIRFANDGKKIPEEIKENIFKPFVMGNQARNSGNGSGLGLAIVHKIINLHNGHISLVDDSISKYNVEFIITLPKTL